MDIRKLVSDAVGKAFKGGWLERKLHGGIQDALSDSIESTVGKAVVERKVQAEPAPISPVAKALEAIEDDERPQRRERPNYGPGYAPEGIRQIPDYKPEILDRLIARFAKRPDPPPDNRYGPGYAPENVRQIPDYKPGGIFDRLVRLTSFPPREAPEPERTDTQPAAVPPLSWWDRLLSKLAGPAPETPAEPQAERPVRRTPRERPSTAVQPQVPDTPESRQPSTTRESQTQPDTNIEAIVADVSSVTNDIHQTSQSIEDILNGLNATFRVNAGNEVVTQERQPQPENRRGSGSGNNRRNRRNRRRRQSGKRGRWTRTFMNTRFTRRGQASTVRFGRNMGRRVAGFFGRSGAAGARMGGRVAAGLARFAGPTAMGIAGAAGSMGPAIIGIAVAGKVLGIVGAVAGVVAVALNKLADSAIAATVRISKYDARLASAGAMLEVGRTMRDIRMAQATGKSGSELLRAQDRFEQKAQPFREELQNISNEIATAWLELKGDFVEAAIPILKFMKDNVAEGFEMVQAALGTIQATIDAIPLLGTYLKLMRDDAADRRKDAQWAARLKERMDRQANAAAVFNNMQQMLDAAARRAPF